MHPRWLNPNVTYLRIVFRFPSSNSAWILKPLAHRMGWITSILLFAKIRLKLCLDIRYKVFRGIHKVCSKVFWWWYVLWNVANMDFEVFKYVLVSNVDLSEYFLFIWKNVVKTSLGNRGLFKHGSLWGSLISGRHAA